MGGPFSPVELDWELVGVAFAYAIPAPFEPAAEDTAPVEAAVIDKEPAPAPQPPARSAHVLGPAVARKRPRKWMRAREQVMAAVRDLGWDGFRSLIADIFRQEGYEVFNGEGPDGDVIDMEVARGDERMLVNCQLRGLGEIDIAPLIEMARVAKRNGADGAFIISDGDFAAEARTFADAESLVLIDRDTLLGLVLDFTLGVEEERRLRARLARLWSGRPSVAGQRAS